MKIRMRVLPPMPLAPPPKPPPTAFQLGLLAEQLSESAQRQKARLKKLFGEQKDRRDFGEDGNSEKREKERRANRNLDILT